MTAGDPPRSKTMTICFRFDVDTPRCLMRGVPALLKLARELGVRFTFFMNPGRAVSLRTLVQGSHSEETAPKLSSLRKLGLRDYLHVAIRNPRLSDLGCQALVAQAAADGHEIGLHGGRNHAAWQHGAHRWSEARVHDELRYGLRALGTMGAANVASFASPGWNTAPGLASILPEYDIKVLADRHGDFAETVTRRSGEAVCVGTDLLGEPGGVGYLEWCIARGLSHEACVERFAQELGQRAHRSSVLYDHPCFAGIEALPLLRDLIMHCRARGVEIKTVSEIAGVSRPFVEGAKRRIVPDGGAAQPG